MIIKFSVFEVFVYLKKYCTSFIFIFLCTFKRTYNKLSYIHVARLTLTNHYFFLPQCFLFLFTFALCSALILALSSARLEAATDFCDGSFLGGFFFNSIASFLVAILRSINFMCWTLV